jgi:uncharacterized protein DUF4202
MSRYDDAVAAIDAANADDPTTIAVRGSVEPLALVHGRLATEWVRRLRPDAPEPVLLAARAHHLRRWEVPRSSYPEGRAGYLRWRRDQKARHATDVATILGPAGYDDSEIARVQALIKREGLGSDPDTQLVEDAACLVFVETQLVSTAASLEPDHMVTVLQKTANKMSTSALALLAEVPLTDEGKSILANAFP